MSYLPLFSFFLSFFKTNKESSQSLWKSGLGLIKQWLLVCVPIYCSAILQKKILTWQSQKLLPLFLLSLWATACPDNTLINNVRSNSVITRLTGCLSMFVLVMIQPQLCVTLDPKRWCCFVLFLTREEEEGIKQGWQEGRKEGGGVEMQGVLSWV